MLSLSHSYLHTHIHTKSERETHTETNRHYVFEKRIPFFLVQRYNININNNHHQPSSALAHRFSYFFPFRCVYNAHIHVHFEWHDCVCVCAHASFFHLLRFFGSRTLSTIPLLYGNHNLMYFPFGGYVIKFVRLWRALLKYLPFHWIAERSVNLSTLNSVCEWARRHTSIRPLDSTWNRLETVSDLMNTSEMMVFFSFSSAQLSLILVVYFFFISSCQLNRNINECYICCAFHIANKWRTKFVHEIRLCVQKCITEQKMIIM